MNEHASFFAAAAAREKKVSQNWHQEAKQKEMEAKHNQVRLN